MALKIISAAERMQQKSAIKGVITGPSGIGKTTLVRTLPEKETLVIDLEAGMLALEGCGVDSLSLRDWETARNLACWIGGPNPAMRPDQSYSQAHYEFVCGEYGSPDTLKKYSTVFVDSITVASRLCFNWCKGQPQAFSDKTGKPDNRGAYGLLGQEMIGWLTQLQHVADKNVWLVGILDKKVDDFGRTNFTLQVEGGKTGLELPGIVDQVVSMVEMKTAEGQPYRAFVCHTINEFGYPAKDRSGRLDCIEQPHLGKLMAKIKGGVRQDAQVVTTLPATTNKE
mgnify:CR=1 FL=1